MHPLLISSELQGLDKALFDGLARKGQLGMSQTKLMQLLELPSSSQSTVSRALNKLMTLGIVVKSGATRDASFNLSPEARWFSVPGHLRPRVDYNPERISGYTPGETKWLAEDARMQMAEAIGTAGLQLDPSTYTREIAERFLIEMSWASSALEGNTYSLPETEALIKYSEVAGGKSEEEVQMILNHKQAISWVIENIGDVQITPDTAFRLHAMLMRTMVRQNNLGAIRKEPVSITTSSYVPSSNSDELSLSLGELCWKVSQIEDPYEASFALLSGVPYLQPFIDGNKRTGRLLSNIPLLKAGLPPISYVGVSRAEYGVAMTTWYELGEPKYLSEAIANGYSLSAPSYLVATATKRVPRSAEIRLRKQLDQAVADFVGEATDDHTLDAYTFAVDRFKDADDADKQIIVASFVEIIDGLNGYNCVAYGVDPQRADAFLAGRNGLKIR